MSDQLRQLLGMDSNVRQLASLLQSKGNRGDTVLAHINPREVALLKAHGGSGRTNPDTGLLQFDDGSDPMSFGQSSYDFSGGQPQFSSPSETFGAPSGSETMNAMPAAQATPAEAPTSFGAPSYDFGGQAAQAAPAAQAPGGGAYPTVGQPFPSAGAGALQTAGGGYDTAQMPSFAPSQGYGLNVPAAPAPGITDQLAKALGVEKGTLEKLGVAGLQSIPGIIQARGAASQAAQYPKQQQAIAQPYQQLGQQLRQQAQSGQLTPQGQQSLEAMRAQAAQGAARRGGVGAEQAANQIENYRQQLLQQQMDYGLKLSGIGDQIALGAIKTGMQADQYVNSLTSNFMSNLFQGFMPPGTRPNQMQAPQGGQ
jgi:hypothetical protein